MANILTTTKIKPVGFVFVAYGGLLTLCAIINLFDTFTFIAQRNSLIDSALQNVAKLATDQQMPQYNKLLHQQERALQEKPSEPYAWARLSYLRMMTGQGDASAFAALRMSDFVSPYEAQQLPERAVSWSKFTNVQNKDERDYQDALWLKSYTVAPDATWDLAARLGLTKTVFDLFNRKNNDLAESWSDRMRDPSIRQSRDPL